MTAPSLIVVEGYVDVIADGHRRALPARWRRSARR